MPIIKSAIKKARQDEKRRKRNLKVKVDLKAKIKNIQKEITAKKLDEAKKNISEVISVLDKAAKRGVIHKNKAARLKSRLVKSLNIAAGKVIELESQKKPTGTKAVSKKSIKKRPKKEAKKVTKTSEKNSKKEGKKKPTTKKTKK